MNDLPSLDPSYVPRFIEITDAPADQREDHAVKIYHNESQSITLFFTCAELNDLVNKCVQRLYEKGQLLWR